MLKAVFAPMAITLTLAAATAHAAEECSLTKISEIELAFDGQGRPLIPVTLGDRSRFLMVDTGGYIGTLNRAAAEAMGLETQRGQIGVIDVEGQVSNDFVVIDEMRIGNLRATDRPFIVDPGAPGFDSEIRYVGTIAPDILKFYDVDFDFGANVMNFFRQDHCEGQVIYWHPQVIAIIPFEIDTTGHIKFDITLDGIELEATLDTGASYNVLNQVIAERRFDLEFSPDAPEAIGSLGNTKEIVYRHTFETLSLEGVEISRPTMNVLPDLWVSGLSRVFGGTRLPQAILGMPVLSQLHLYIAYGEKRLYVTAAES
jgi:predicted aspartyl protease